MIVKHLSTDKQFSLSGQKFIIFNRESNGPKGRAACKQDSTLHHSRCLEYLRQYVEERGGMVVEEYRENATGFAITSHRGVLLAALDRCRITGSCLLAASANRLMRPRDWHSTKCFDRQAGPSDWEWFDAAAAGVEVYTVRHPAEDERTVSSELTKVWMMRRRSLLQPPRYVVGRSKVVQDVAWEMMCSGKSLQCIALECGVPKSTVAYWNRTWMDGLTSPTVLHIHENRVPSEKPSSLGICGS